MPFHLGHDAPQTVGIVHIIVSAETTKDGLTVLPDHAVPPVLAAEGVGEDIASHLGKYDGIIEFPIGKQSSVRCDLRCVKFRLQATVRIDPEARCFDSPIGCAIITT